LGRKKSEDLFFQDSLNFAQKSEKNTQFFEFPTFDWSIRISKLLLGIHQNIGEGIYPKICFIM